ncbi:coiled-coil domain-containing protein 137-like [Glandiceps talaboti]
MGRHKKVKKVDPFYSEKGKKPKEKNHRLKKLEKKKNVNNLRPDNLDDQDKVSQKFKLFMDRMKAGKELEMKRKKKKKNGKLQRVKLNSHLKPEDRGKPGFKPMKFQKKPRESEKNFNLRMEKKTRKVIEDTKMKIKLEDGADPVDEVKENNTGMSERKKERLQKKREKLKARKQKKVEEKLEKDQFKDEVKFGEVVMQPPDLTAKPRKSSQTMKPGKKSLLLKSMLDKSMKKSQQGSDVVKKKSSHGLSAVTKTKKRKHMSAAEQRKFDKAQALAIVAYREAKKAKRKAVTKNK